MKMHALPTSKQFGDLYQQHETKRKAAKTLQLHAMALIYGRSQGGSKG